MPAASAASAAASEAPIHRQLVNFQERESSSGRGSTGRPEKTDRGSIRIKDPRGERDRAAQQQAAHFAPGAHPLPDRLIPFALAAPAMKIYVLISDLYRVLARLARGSRADKLDRFSG